MTTSPPVVDVGRLLDHGAWSTFQKAILGLIALAIVFDGFDLQLLAFAIPALVKEWNVPRGSFALILAVGLIGMSIGTAAAGILGDRIGRKRALIVSFLVFGVATAAAAFSGGLTSLGVLRFIAGAGLGGSVPNATALSAEFTPLKRRALAVSITIVCIPLGGALAGAVASRTLATFGWRYLFAWGGFAALAFVVLLIVFLPESPRFLVRQPAQWPELRRLLAKIGQRVHPETQFADFVEQSKERGNAMAALFGPSVIRNTASLWLCFLSCMLAVYLALNWLPTYLSAQGFDFNNSSSGGSVYGFGGVAGALFCALCINRFGSRLTMLAACAGAILTALFLWNVPPAASSTAGLPLFALAAHGFFANGTQTTMFALAAHIYPTMVRAGGVAAAIAIGRIGAVASAFLGASLVKAGPARYFGAISLGLTVTLIGLALVADHIPRFRPEPVKD